MSADPLGSSEVRWAVRVTTIYQGGPGDPHLAGRYYFNAPRGPDDRSADAHPPTATFRTRAQARERAAAVRTKRPGWRVVATPVRVVVTTRLAEAES